MTGIIANFRKWWQPPRRAIDRDPERRVTFLELFYDLVYVVLVAQLAHALAENATLGGVWQFAFLFIIVWWAWFNGSTYADVHGNNDIRTRLFTFLQMFTVAAMAVFAYGAMGDTSAGFALAYAAFQLILTYLWWRTGVHDPLHRPLSQPYSLAFLITTLLFAFSILLPLPLRFYVWGLAIIISLLLPFNMFRQGQEDEAVQEQVERMLDVSPALVERFGLLTIIVLGEVIVGTVSGVAAIEQLTWTVGLTAVLGMLIAIGIWWIYFDFVSMRLPQRSVVKVVQWFYLHLPLTAGIVAAGAAVFNVVENSGEPLAAAVRWLLAGAVALVLCCVSLLMRTIRLPEAYLAVYRRGGILGVITAALIFLLGFVALPTIPFLIILVALLIVPIIYGVKVWIQQFNAEEIPLH